MRVILKDGLIVLAADCDEDRAAIARHLAPAAGRIFRLAAASDRGASLHAAGPQDDTACQPINVTSMSADPAIRLIGNFAATPFVLDGAPYGSVEGFWQSLKFTDPAARRRVAALSGRAAKQAGTNAPRADMLAYWGRPIRVGRPEHWALMHRACAAKFAQNTEARDALVRTGHRFLTHRLRRDSETIPGVVMADIWMRIRAGLGP